MCSQDKEVLEADAVQWHDEVITVGSDSKDRTMQPGTVFTQTPYPHQQRYDEIGNFSPNKNGKPTIISTSKGGIFDQGQIIRISPNFKNAVSYQWIKNGISLGFCTGPILEISNANLYNSGDYALMAANPFGIEITPPINVKIV